MRLIRYLVMWSRPARAAEPAVAKENATAHGSESPDEPATTAANADGDRDPSGLASAGERDRR
jgi:hypothetical protein